MSSQEESLFKVVFYYQSRIYEIYAKSVEHASLYGFVEISGIVFNNHSKLVLDPSEEKLKQEFADVQKSFIPMHNILRIDKVKKQGIAKIKDNKDGNNIMEFPKSIYPDPNSN